nr:hypothetical protein [Tanacetum cinerariifolium]
MIEKCIVEIQGTFLVKARDYAFNGKIRENAFKHVNNFLEIIRTIKINGLTQDLFRLSVFPVSLVRAASEWFAKECIGSITTWDSLIQFEMMKQLFVNISSDEDVTTTPSPKTTSSSPTPPNAPSKPHPSIKPHQGQENTSSPFQLRLYFLPPSSNEPTSPHPLNLLLDNISNVPSKPLNPQPLQSHPSSEITLSLSPITPLDHIHDTPSPPSPQQHQPPIMGYPFYYNYRDYHGSNCICCFHNQTLFLTLRDDINIMFAHLEYLLTTAITSQFPPPL